LRKLGPVLAAMVAVAVLAPATASAVPPTNVAEATSTFTFTPNMHPLGFSGRDVPLDNTVPGSGVFNSDLAFWGKTAVQGTYGGFRLIDITEPDNPQEIINWDDCASGTNTVGNQGDVIVWGDLIIRSWNSGTPAPRYPDGTVIPVTDPARFTTPGAFCGDWPMFREPAAPPLPERGQEGVHIIDISDPTNPDVIGFVDTPCGSHTETLVPDLENNRLLVYSNSSANTTFGVPGGGETPLQCAGIDVIEVPLDDPASASYLRFEQAGDPMEDEHHSCHDTAVILGDANLVACAGTAGMLNTGVNVFSIDPADGGSKEDPVWLYHKVTGGISLGHSAAFTWDGEVLVVGHEPGGGSGANCEATDNPLERTFFFLNARTGASLGQFTIPRPQTNVENCTTHNYNIVPTKRGYVMVSGNYQSGISVIDFTDPANAREIAFADPAPLVDPNPPVGIELGGDWSTYWYNGFIYESDISRGLIVWRLSDKAVAGAMRLSHLNPQTTEFTF
jgi:LVIVD repeat